MSIEKNIQESNRWLTTSKDDLDSAMILKDNKKYAHACFHAQQAGEKALKAVWHYADADPWGHSIKKLIDDLESVEKKFFDKLKSLMRVAIVLDRFYIPTRYPNGLPDITPDVAFTEEDAEVCINYSKQIVDAVHGILAA